MSCNEKTECKCERHHHHHGRIENKSSMELEICGKKKTIHSNTVHAHTVNVEITKSQDCDLVFVGEEIMYHSVLKNHSGMDIENVIFRDRIPHGTDFVEGSLKIVGATGHTTFHNREISVKIEKLHARKDASISFKVKAL